VINENSGNKWCDELMHSGMAIAIVNYQKLNIGLKTDRSFSNTTLAYSILKYS